MYKVEISQRDLCDVYGLRIKNELATRFAGLKITFPADLYKLGIGDLQDNYAVTKFSNLVEEDVTALASMGITAEKINQVVHLANYYAERHYLGKQIDAKLESDLNGLSNQGIQFTIFASTSGGHKNLANHSWQHHSNGWRR